MAGLLTVAQVTRGDGVWTAGYDSEALACGFQVSIADPCSEDSPVAVVTPPDAATGGITNASFAVITELTRVNRCTSPDDRELIIESADTSLERAIGARFWTDLQAAVAAPTEQGLATLDDLVSLLDTFYGTSALYAPIVHMGLGTAMALETYLTPDMARLRSGQRVVISEGYPSDALGVSGPVRVHIGTLEVTVNYKVSVNETFFETTRLATIDFDPCAANYIAAPVTS